MKKILLVDHWGSCDSDGEPIGHTLKVIREYKNLLSDDCLVGVAMPDTMVKKASTGEFYKVHRLKYSICESQPKSLLEKVEDKLKVFYNLYQIRKIQEYDIVWYIRSDFFLFFYFLLHQRHRKQKLYTLVYHNEYAKGVLGKVLDIFYRKGIQQFDGILYTQRKMKIPHPRLFYMPDYLYDADIYQKYTAKEKQSKVICVGTINSDKNVEDLVRAFNKNKFPLEIAGRFLDVERYERLKSMADSHILIENRILSNEEYYHRLGEAKFSVLPYRINAYAGRTSGVLQESIFVGTIPIAPKQLLEINEIPGIGYEEIGELAEGWFADADGKEVIRLINKNVDIGYNSKSIGQRLQAWLKDE